MNRSSLVPCELLSWDTEFFGCRIARVCGDTLNREQAAEIEAWCRSNRVRCLYFLARADDPATIQTAAQHDFGLVDIRITFDQSLVDWTKPAETGDGADINIRPAQTDDLPQLQALARVCHRETRFFNDQNFPRPQVENFYSTWISLEIQGRAQLVLVAASPANQPVGYVSCHLDPARREGRIGLVGVSPEIRGQGIGMKLLLSALNWFSIQGAQRIAVVTQGNNLAAQRLYQRCGFLNRNLQLWYHKWNPTGD